MEDKLPEVIAAGIARRKLALPLLDSVIELISFRTFDTLDIKAIRMFQAKVSERYGIELAVVGGGYGCSRIIFEVSTEHPDLVTKRILELLQDPEFKKIALEGGFHLAVSPQPYARIDLRNGKIEGLQKKQGLLMFYSYSHKDEEYREELNKHLAVLKWQGLVRDWHDRRIPAGEEWEKQIDSNLQRADIILLLISADFIASKYCYDVEMRYALSRHEAGKARVIPIIVRPVDLELVPFRNLQFVPRDGRAVASWPDHDEAWVDVVKQIRVVVQNMRPSGKASDQGV